MRFRYALYILLSAFVISTCSDDSPTSSTSPNTVSQEIGPEGGEITSEDGDLTLAFPEGALTSSETITIETLDPGNLPEPFEEIKDVTAAYELGPDGLTFDVPVIVTYDINKNPEEEDGTLSLPVSVLLTEGKNGQPEFLDNLSTGINSETGRTWTTGGLNHFSTIIDIEQENIRIRITGVPASLPTNEIFTINASVNASSIDGKINTSSSVTYHDESILPLTLTEPKQNPIELSREKAAFTGEIEYTCTAPEKDVIYNAYFQLTDIQIFDKSGENTYKTDLRLLGNPDYDFKSLYGILPGGPPLANVTCTEPVEPQYSVDASKTCVPGSVSDTGEPYVQLHWLAELDQHSKGNVTLEVETPDGETVTYEKEISETPESSSSFEGEGYASFVHNLLNGTTGTYNYHVTALDESGELIYPDNGISGSIDVSEDEIEECEGS